MPFIDVLDSTMSYVEVGDGVPIVFLHGNPTSSYLWRNVLPHFQGIGRAIAPDLIGMGGSGKPSLAYDFDDHARYLGAWFDELELDDVVLVGHDWGGALAFDWAANNPRKARGVAFLETIVHPMSWAGVPEQTRELFTSIRTPGVGEAMVLENNMFIEQALPYGIQSGLSETDWNVYRAPYPTPESRLPLLQWPRALPFDGVPADVTKRVESYDRWLAASSVPKLLVSFDPGPGMLIGPDVVSWCESHISNLDVASCGPAGHHAPEDQPDAIARAIVAWMIDHDLSNAGNQPVQNSKG